MPPGTPNAVMAQTETGKKKKKIINHPVFVMVKGSVLFQVWTDS
jgi:hypothetical protein